MGDLAVKNTHTYCFSTGLAFVVLFFFFFFYRGGGAEGRGHETGFYVFPPFPLFISWVLLSLPGHTGYARVFLALNWKRHTSPLSSSSSTDHQNTLRTPYRTERAIGRTWKVPPLSLHS